MKLEYKSLYSQAYEMIRTMIKNGYTTMQRIPTENELSKQLGVSRNTVREAIKTLEQEGILYSRQGVGTFVIGTNKHLETSISTLESSTNIIRSQGYTPNTKNVNYKVVKPSSEIKKALSLNGEKDIFYIERVRTANQEPVVYVEDYILYEEGMDDLYTKRSYESLLEFLAEFGIEISFAVCSIKAIISDEKIEKKLELEEKHPLLLLEQEHYTKEGLPIFYSESYYLSNKFEFNVIRRKL